MSQDYTIDNNFDTFFDDDKFLHQMEKITGKSLLDEGLNRYNDHYGDKFKNAMNKGVNYIQNYKNNFKNTGYSELQKKKITMNKFNTNIVNKKQINPEFESGLSTINFEPSHNIAIQNVNHDSHSPLRHKIVDALHSIDNIIVTITKKENRKIDNFLLRRDSNFREKTRNSLTSLVNIVNSQASGQIIASPNISGNNDVLETRKAEENNNNTIKTQITSANSNNGKSKLYQRNLNALQAQSKLSDMVSENKKESTFEPKNSRNIYNANLRETSSKCYNDKANFFPNTYHLTNTNNYFYNNDSYSSEKENIYKRPLNNRELSKDINNEGKKSVKINLICKESITDDVNNNSIKISKIMSNKEFFKKFKLVNYNIISSLAKIENKNASFINENKQNISISTIMENMRSHSNNHKNLSFIYDESIKDPASEEMENNVDSLMLINKRFLDIINKAFDEKLNLQSNIPIATACKISNDLLSEIKSQGEKETSHLINKYKELEEKNNELTMVNTVYKDNLLKISVNNEKTVSDLSHTIKDLQKYLLKLEKENVVLKNEFINNIKNKNGMIKKFNEDLTDYQKISKKFMQKYTEIENID